MVSSRDEEKMYGFESVCRLLIPEMAFTSQLLIMNKLYDLSNTSPVDHHCINKIIMCHMNVFFFFFSKVF